MSDPRGIIARIRDGEGLDAAGAQMIARGLSEGSLTDGQAAAFAMAVLLRGTGDAGRVALTQAMRDSGHVMRWDLPGPVIDKHSTGGVGDTVSLVLAPLLAACGAYVPMISGRGLGHTGGTLDKLEAIPGFSCDLAESDFRRIVGDVGCAIVAASKDLAPADARLYAIRDETGTVESVDLITASILSKKLAAGLDGLVLDVKVGSGAFMADEVAARTLAQALVATANAAGCKASAIVSDMDQPLARNAGNALEVAEAIATLHGKEGALRDLTLELAAECLRLARHEADLPAILASGKPAEIFAGMVAAQGGSGDLIDRPEMLPRAPVIRSVPTPAGVVSTIDATRLGQIVVRLGGGRIRASDRVDPRVGLSDMAKLGDHVGPDRPLAMVHAASEADADLAVSAVQSAYKLGETSSGGPLVRFRVHE